MPYRAAAVAVDLDVEVLTAGDLLRIDVARAWHRPDHVRDFARQSPRADFRSVPKIFTPTSERMPVVSMSMRLMIGIVQMFVTPGSCTARPISARSRSSVMPGRHCSRRFQMDDRLGHVQRRRIGRRLGAARPSRRPTRPPETSSGPRSVCWRSCVFSSSEMLGSAIGMNIRSPSFSGGMNSLPMPRGQHQSAREQERGAGDRDGAMRQRRIRAPVDRALQAPHHRVGFFRSETSRRAETCRAPAPA